MDSSSCANLRVVGVLGENVGKLPAGVRQAALFFEESGELQPPTGLVRIAVQRFLIGGQGVIVSAERSIGRRQAVQLVGLKGTGRPLPQQHGLLHQRPPLLRRPRSGVELVGGIQPEVGTIGQHPAETLQGVGAARGGRRNLREAEAGQLQATAPIVPGVLRLAVEELHDPAQVPHVRLVGGQPLGGAEVVGPRIRPFQIADSPCQLHVGVREQGAGVAGVQQVAEARNPVGVGQHLAARGEPVLAQAEAARQAAAPATGLGAAPAVKRRLSVVRDLSGLPETVGLVPHRLQMSVAQLQVQEGVLGGQRRRRLQIGDSAFPLLRIGCRLEPRGRLPVLLHGRRPPALRGQHDCQSNRDRRPRERGESQEAEGPAIRRQRLRALLQLSTREGRPTVPGAAQLRRRNRRQYGDRGDVQAEIDEAMEDDGGEAEQRPQGQRPSGPPAPRRNARTPSQYTRPTASRLSPSRTRPPSSKASR